MTNAAVERIEAEIERLKGRVGGLQDRVDLAALQRYREPDEKEFKAALTELTNTLAELNRLTDSLYEQLADSQP